MESKIFKAKVMHSRLHPKKHFFYYNVMYLYLDICNIQKIKTKLLGVNKFNLFSFMDKFHGFKTDKNKSIDWLKQTLETNNIISFIDISKTKLIAMPAFLGYVFNPISFWLCYNFNKQLVAIVYEVNNTFGKSYSYCIYKPNLQEITKNDELFTNKILHVSPFFAPEGIYSFKVNITNNNINIFINYFVNNTLMLKTSLCGELITLNSINLLKHVIKYPLPNLRVLFLIHYHALLLFIKKIKFYGKNPKL